MIPIYSQPRRPPLQSKTFMHISRFMPKAGFEASCPSMHQHLTHFTNAHSAYNAAKAGYEERVRNVSGQFSQRPVACRWRIDQVSHRSPLHGLLRGEWDNPEVSDPTMGAAFGVVCAPTHVAAEIGIAGRLRDRKSVV